MPNPTGVALLLGVLLLLRTASTEEVKTINAYVGQTIPMTPVFVGVPQGFEWKMGTTKIIEVDYPATPVPFSLYTRRFHFVNETGVLTIKELQPTDSGKYSAQVLVDRTYQTTAFQLTVFPVLNKPTVNCACTNAGVVIRCRHDPDPPSYEWFVGEHPISSSLPNYNLTDQNRSLTLSLPYADTKSLKSLECVVKNPATENRSSVPETCFEKDSHGRGRSGLIAATVVFVLLILLIGYGYQQTPGNDADQTTRRSSNSEGGQSNNVKNDGSEDIGAESALSAPVDSQTEQKEKELVKGSQSEHVQVHDPRRSNP